MSEEQGKVIDGTVRARHWRGSRSKSATGADDEEPHAAAPKSVASSLLVPSSMLEGGMSEPSVEVLVPSDHRTAGATIEKPPDAATRAATGENLFLAPDAAVIDRGEKRDTRRRIAPVRRLRDGIARARTLKESIGAPWLVHRLPLSRVVVALGVALVAVGGTLAILRSETTSPSVPRSSAGTATAARLDGLAERLRAAVGRVAAAVPARTPARPPHARRPHKRSVHTRPSPPAAITRSASPIVTASNAPPPAASTVTSTTSNSGSSGVVTQPPSVGTASPSTSATHPRSSSRGSARAFGQSGVLAPGSSPTG